MFFMTGAGKDIISCYAASRIRVKEDGKVLPNLMVSPNVTILQQLREEYFPTFAPQLTKEEKDGNLILSTYQSYDKIKHLKYGLTIFLECHVLPANGFSRLATIRTKYRIGQSASPFREDGRNSLIYALTGFPLGLNYQATMRLLGKKYHDINVYIFNDLEQKIKFATNLVAKDTKTLIFVDKIQVGEKLSNLLGVPFIHGATRNRIQIAKESRVFVASRVMELGISLKELEHIIEVDFLYGSRREQLQRTGRLFHSKEAKKHDILFTQEEFEKYGKRLHSLVEKGFKINLKPMISGTFKVKKPEIVKVSKKSNFGSVVNDLFDEGFFVTERTFGDIWERVVKKGIPNITVLRNATYTKILAMVKSKKIYKVLRQKKNYFVQR